MKAVYLEKKGDPKVAFQVRDKEKPVPKENEIRIKVEAFGLNYADVMARNGLYREAPPMPCVLGYEVVGVVDQVANESDKYLIGKRVVAFTRFGGYAEYVVTNNLAVSIIDDLDVGKGLCIATQFVTAYYMSHVITQFFPGDKVLIHAGAGGVGMALIQFCKQQGCEVFATAGSDEKLDFMRQLGADHVINYRRDDYEVEIDKILGKDRLDATFNPIAGETFRKDFRLIGAGGRLILFGGSARSAGKWGIFSTLNFVRKMGLVLPIGTMMRSKSILGVNMLKIGDQRPMVLKHCLDEVAKLMLANKLQVHIGGAFSVDQIDEAHELLESRKSKGKLLIHW